MNIKLNTDRIILRDFNQDDYDFFYNLETNEFTLKYEADSIPTKEYVDKKFDDMMNLITQENRVKYVMLVERIEDKTPLGKVLIWQIDKAIDEWEMGWVFLRKHTGKGYATEAAKELIDFGFKVLGANRICANCNDANVNSERVMQRVGMKKEGVFRQTRKLYDKWYGSCIYSILRSEYDKNL